MNTQAWIFGVAEGPVKNLLKTFFLGLGDTDHELPSEYVGHIKMLRILDELPMAFVTHDSLIKIPPRPAEAPLTTPTGEKRNLKIMLVPNTHVWEESQFEGFDPTQVGKIKHTMIQMIRACDVVFNTLKHVPKNNKLLETLTLETDPENLTLRVQDSRFEYDHDYRLSPLIVASLSSELSSESSESDDELSTSSE